MNTKPLFLQLSLSAVLAVTAQMLPLSAQADILAVAPNAQVLKKANTPQAGQSMESVIRKFGNAKNIRISTGKATKRNPRITRWDYSGFSVYFENSHVIHSVVHR